MLLKHVVICKSMTKLQNPYYEYYHCFRYVGEVITSDEAEQRGKKYGNQRTLTVGLGSLYNWSPV